MAAAAEKLDALMRLTDTKNHSLAEALSFSTSYISRIRTGKREIPSNSYFVEPAADFFARRLEGSYRTRAVAELVCPGKEWPTSHEGASKLIADWLNSDEKTLASVNGILASLASDMSNIYSVIDYHGHTQLKRHDQRASDSPCYHSFDDLVDINGIGVCYGNEGKRRCVQSFFENLAEREEPVELLLHTGECRRWIDEEPNYSKYWFVLLYRILAQGGHITLVHGQTRDFDSIFEGISRWLPLYMMGGVDSFWCPHLRGGILRRTLYVAPEISAFSSTSVADETENMANFIYVNSQLVAAQQQEFMELLSCSEPLVRRCLLSDTHLSAHMLRPFLQDQGKLSVVMSEDLRHNLQELLTPQYQKFLKDFGINLGRDGHDLDQIRWATQEKLPPKLCMAVKEGLGVCVLRFAEPQMLFVVTEPTIIEYLHDYVNQL